MVDSLKKKISGRNFIAYLILGALVLVFVLFDLRPGGQMGIGEVASVNRTSISLNDFRQEETRIQQYYSNLFGGGLDLGPQAKFLRQQAVENLIRQELVFQASQQAGLLATDLEVRDFILSELPSFQENGVFQKDRYSQFLSNNRWTPAQFEGMVRKQILLLRSRRLVEASSQPLKLELDKQRELKSQQMNIQFVKLSQQELSGKVKVNAEEVDGALSQPETLKAIEEEFKATKNEYNKIESVKAQHILFGIPPGASAEKLSEVQKKAEEVLKKVQAKEDFGKLAQTYSEDPGSKSSGGDLGSFGRGKMVKEFDDVAFALKPGEVSGLVKSQFGFHIIKVNEKTEAQEAQFETHQRVVAQRFLAKKKIQTIEGQLEEALTAKNEPGLEAPLKALGLSWEETGDFDFGVEMIPKLSGPNLAAAAFELSEKKPLPLRLIREGGSSYLLRLKGLKVNSGVEAPKSDLLSRQKTALNYESWLAQFRKESKVFINNQIFAD